MYMYKKRKTIRKTISIVLAIALFATVIIYEYNQRFYDKTKDSIFELSNTACTMIPYFNPDEALLENHYIIQDLPKNRIQMEKMIDEFLNNKDVLQSLYNEYESKDIGYIKLFFRKPSWDLPVYWEGTNEQINGYGDELLASYLFSLSPNESGNYILVKLEATFFIKHNMEKITNHNYESKTIDHYASLSS